MATKWTLDPSHSEVEFQVKHMMISTVTGSFTKFDAVTETYDPPVPPVTEADYAAYEANPDYFMDATVTFTIDVDSITTGNAQRDDHLKSPDFFDAAQFPQIKFVINNVEKDPDGTYKANGDLTMHGVTKSVQFNVEYGGKIQDPWGNTRAGATVSGTINRQDFGLSWNSTIETGSLIVSNDVLIHAGLEFIKT